MAQQSTSLYVALFTLGDLHMLKYGISVRVETRIQEHVGTGCTPWVKSLTYDCLAAEFKIGNRGEARVAELALKRAARSSVAKASAWDPCDDARLPVKARWGCPSGEWLFARRGQDSALVLTYTYSWLAKRCGLNHLMILETV